MVLIHSNYARDLFNLDGADIILQEFYDHSILRRIEFDEDEVFESEYWLYHFHPILRVFLSNREDLIKKDLDTRYGDNFAKYYSRLLDKTYEQLSKATYRSYLTRFNYIFRQENNDFEKSLRVTVKPERSFFILRVIGLILQRLSQFNLALVYHRKALSLEEQHHDKLAMAMEYGNCGNIFYKIGKLDEAIEYYKKSLEIHAKYKDEQSMAADYNNLGAITSLVGNIEFNKNLLEEGIEYLKEAISFNRKINDLNELAKCYGNLGNLYASLELLDESMIYYKESLNNFEKIDD